MDAYVPEPTRDLDKPFLMPIEDVFSIKGRGTVATGRIETGIVKINEEVEIVGIRPTKKQSLRVSKPLRSHLTKVKPVIMRVYYFEESNVMTSKEVRCLQKLVLLRLTLNLTPKSTFLLKKKRTSYSIL